MPTDADSPEPSRQNVARIARSLRRRLEDDGRAGLTAVPRASAQPKPRRAKTPPETAGAPATPPAESPAPATATPGAAADTAAAPGATGSSPARAAELLEETAAPVVAQSGLDFGTPDLDTGADHEPALARIAAEVAECTRCAELVANRTLTVPGQGNPYARLVFIGEGPGQEEDRQGLAFVGRAGELLTKMIDAIGMTREEVYIANIVKCRPPGNRQPTPEEAANCAGYLARQLEILRPKIIVALGGTAAQNLLQTRDGITRLRGRFYPYGSAQLMPTFHPAYVLRNYTQDTRKKVYDDLLKVKAALLA